MIRVRAWSIALIGILMAGGVWLWFGRSADAPLSTIAEAGGMAEFEAARSPESRTSNTTKADVPIADERAVPNDGMATGRNESLQQAIENPSSSPLSTNEQSLGGTEDADRARIPFRVSDSIVRACDEYQGEQISCDRHFAVLARLKDEKRDSAWASSMEKSITSIVAAESGFFIRALECRASVCAMEIESTEYFDTNKFEILSNRLVEVDSIRGYEVNEKNEKIRVRSLTFERRDASSQAVSHAPR